MRRTAWVVVVAALLWGLAAAVALGQEVPSFEGTYVGTVQTSGGNQLGCWMQVQDVGNGSVRITFGMPGGLSFPLPRMETAPSGPNAFTIKPVVWIPGVVDGSGEVTFTYDGTEWIVAGVGSGSVRSLSTGENVSGSASGTGRRVTSEFIKPEVVLSAEATSQVLVPPGSSVDQVLLAIKAAQKQPEVSDAEKAGAALADDVAVITGVLLCIAMGATMSGQEFVDLWESQEGSQP